MRVITVMLAQNVLAVKDQNNLQTSTNFMSFILPVHNTTHIHLVTLVFVNIPNVFRIRIRV